MRFLFYNFNPATIFMGDTGSMFLGFVLATTAIQTNQKSTTAVALVVPIIALALPIADTLLAMLRRAARGAPLFSADRGHIHHRLLRLGLSQRQAVLVLYGACVLLGGSAVAMSFASAQQAGWFLLTLAVFGALALWKLGFFDLAALGRVLEERKRNAEMRGRVRRVGTALRTARSERDIVEALRQGAQAVGAAAVALRTQDRSEAVLQGFGTPGLDAGVELLSARFSLMGERPGAKHLVLTWDDGRAEVDRDTEIAVEALCQHLSVALDRVPVVDVDRFPMMKPGSA